MFDAFREPMVGANRPSIRGSYALGGAMARVVAGGAVIPAQVAGIIIGSASRVVPRMPSISSRKG